MQILFGGTFDPVHNGHVAMAKVLLETFVDAEVHIIPNHQSPNKESSEGSHHRFKMLELAMQDIPGARVNPIEMHRPGPSYTIDTVKYFRSHYGERESLVLCLGVDAAGDLERWHEKTDLPQLCHLCILNRSSYLINLSEVVSSFIDTDDLDLLFNQSFGLRYSLLTPDIPVSSTAIRRLIREQKRKLPVPSKVADYINHHHLYQDVK